jgi:hypothetical protein
MNRLTHLTAAGLVAGLTASVSASPYSDAVIASNPVSYFQFDGDYTDSGSGDNDGTAVSGGIPFGTAGTVFHPSLNQFADTNETGSISLGASNAASSLSADLQGAAGVSVEAIVDLNSVGGESNPVDAILFLPNGTSAGLTLGIANFENRIVFGGRSQASDSFVSRFASDFEGVRHIVYTIDYATTGITLYVDGQLVASSTGSSLGTFDGGNTNTFGSNTYAVPGSATNDQIGTAEGGGSAFNGDFDELAVYNRVLTASEIQAHFNAIPEPGSMALLALGTACFLTRRRQP